MAEFNITNSKIEQLADSGNNYKSAGDVVIAKDGNAIKVVGDNNQIPITQPPGFWTQAVDKLKGVWKWFIGLFGVAG